MPAYGEFAPPPGLEAQVACVWVGSSAAARVLPDACTDIVFSAGRLVVAGPATLPDLVPATPGQDRCGVRFRVGLAGSALGLPASDLLDQVVPLAEVWGAEGRRLEDQVAAAERPLEVMIAGVAARIAGARDEVAREAVGRVRHGETSVERLARASALSERQLRRRFERSVGYGPRTLRRVLRFQRFLAAAQVARPGSLARLAADAGYADQAHLARDCRRLAGLTPGALLAEGAGPAGERPVARMSETFKTGAVASATLRA
jgi:AraC-like DNA-binding protein